MLSYEELNTYLETVHRYADITPEELNLCPVANWVSTLSGVAYVGTNELVEEWESKRLIPAPPPVEEPPV